DPYVVLAQLASEAGAGSDTDEKKTGVLPQESGRPGLRGGEGYVDPFNPSSWSTIAQPEGKASRVPPPDAATKQLSAEIEAVTGTTLPPEARAGDGKEAARIAMRVLPARDQPAADRSTAAEKRDKAPFAPPRKEAMEGDQPAPATGRAAKVAETAEKDAASLKQ